MSSLIPANDINANKQLVLGTLTRMLEMTSDAVIIFNDSGSILLSNGLAQELLGTKDILTGYNVRKLFWSSEDTPVLYNVLHKSGNTSSLASLFSGRRELLLPFLVDGTAHMCMGGVDKGSGQLLVVRADEVSDTIFIAILKKVTKSSQIVLSHHREFADLIKANYRLAGTLKIMLDTLTFEDVNELFDQSLQEIQETMQADGAILYLYEKDGFKYQASTESLYGRKIASFLPYGKSFEVGTIEAQFSVRFHVLETKPSEVLRQGMIKLKKVKIEDTGEVKLLPARSLPPFKSFISVPVWFDGHAIAIIVVGWNNASSLDRQDAKLLDSVAEYLSIQMMGALKSLHVEKQEHLNRLEVMLWDHLSSKENFSFTDVTTELLWLTDEVNAYFVPLTKSRYFGKPVVNLPNEGETDVPFSFEQLFGQIGYIDKGEDVEVVTLPEDCQFARWLTYRKAPNKGVLISLNLREGTFRGLILRDAFSEAFDDSEVSFWHRSLEIFVEAAKGIQAHEADKKISEALQQGMKNELQTVRGISSYGIYNSATANAFVGGDFYDLIDLNDGKACVLMGDVSGKGVEAASVSAAVKTALAAYAWTGISASAMVRTLNEFLIGFSKIETFATLFVGLIDLKAGTVTYCSAGHPPALLYNSQDNSCDILDVQSGAVGAFSKMVYKDGQVNIYEGDILLLYTDGVTEARSLEGGFFGERRLRETMLRVSKKGLKHCIPGILETLHVYTSGHLEDDVALVALRFDAVKNDYLAQK